MRKRLPWFEILLTVVFLSATLYAAFSDAYNLPNRWFIRDDAYYYFKVAQNVAQGHGSTFDGIHPTNGYHPLWLLICIPIFALARFDLILPLRVLAVLIGVLQVSTAILLYRLIRSAVSTAAGVLAACFWAFNSYVLVFLYKTGVESNIALFFLLLLLCGLYRFEKTWRKSGATWQQIAGFGALAALVMFSRLDLIFFAAIIGLWIVFRSSALRYLLPLDVLALVVATACAFLWRLGFAAYYDVANSAIIMLSLALVVKVPIMYFMGLYTSPRQWAAHVNALADPARHNTGQLHPGFDFVGRKQDRHPTAVLASHCASGCGAKLRPRFRDQGGSLRLPVGTQGPRVA